MLRQIVRTGAFILIAVILLGIGYVLGNHFSMSRNGETVTPTPITPTVITPTDNIPTDIVPTVTISIDTTPTVTIPTDNIPTDIAPAVPEVPTSPSPVISPPSTPMVQQISYGSLPMGLIPWPTDRPPDISFVDGNLVVSGGFKNVFASQEIKPFFIEFFLNDQQQESIINSEPLGPGEIYQFEKIMVLPEDAQMLSIKISVSTIED